MKVAHVTLSTTAEGGGISESVRELTLAQTAAGLSVKVYGLQDSGTSLQPWPLDSPVQVPAYRIPGLRIAPQMGRYLNENSPALVHTHGLWSFPSMIVPGWGKKYHRPWLVSPHGMLDPWAIKNSVWKKKIAAALYEKRHLQGAACLHALCASEADSIRRYGLKNPICIIPNGINLPDEMSELPQNKIVGQKKILLFLGRLHPKKGILNTLKAWARIDFHNEWVFVIAGWDQGGHKAEAITLCQELGLRFLDQETFSEDIFSFPLSQFQVLFTGPVFGNEKNLLLRNASAFILPSLSEGLPMAVLEAWAYRIPVLMTDHCNLPEGFAAAASIRIGTDPASLADGLRLLQETNPVELALMGEKGRALVREKFNWPDIAQQIKDLYLWILGEAPQPASVI